MIKETSEATLLARCIAGIEAKLGWGDSANWSKADFEQLSEIITDETGVALSVTTLKRIWGKVKYDNKPTVTTLNTLARFSGYENWRVFVQQQQGQTKANAQPLPVIEQQHILTPAVTKTKPAKFFAAATALFSITLLVFFVFMRKPAARETADTSKFKFSLNKMVAEGVPNSVVFNYDASSALTDSVFIVQTWDVTRKVLVPKTKTEYSTIYYYPGYFRTKLIADNKIAKEKDLMITTDGWLAVAEQSPVPVYFAKNEFLKNNVAEITAANMQAHNIAMEPITPRLRFFNMRDMGDLQNDNFSFETTIRSDFKKGAAVCQFVQVLIQCKDDIIIIPLCAKACVGDLSLYFAGKGVTSKDADLSKFGCDLSKWTTLRVEAKDHNVQIYVNNQQAYSLTFPHAATGIVGLQYRFDGSGAIKDTKISDGKNSYNF